MLEDNPIFNAGTGAVLNFDGFCELDACVMESREARVGAVSGLQRVSNPVLVARKVMEETDHVMLTGDGAQRFARVMGFPDHDPVTPERRADWFDKRNRIDEVLGEHALKMRRFLQGAPGVRGRHGRRRRGGRERRARRGDLHRRRDAQDGGPRGRFARSRARATTPRARVAASATGTGEFVLRSLATRAISERVEHGASLADAVAAVLDRLGEDFDADVGLIAVDRRGTPVAMHRTQRHAARLLLGRRRRGLAHAGLRRLEKRCKIPVSTLVVIYTPALDVLLIERADRPGFWQSVTGSQDPGETLAARRPIREVREETGHRRDAPRAGTTGRCATSTRSIAIWRHRYAPGVTHNTEHVFGLRVPGARST